MTDIWDEKPELAYNVRDVRWYSGDDMDVWLEKVKARLDLLETIEGAELVGLFGIGCDSELKIIEKSRHSDLEEKEKKYDAWLIDKTDGEIITITQEKWQECLSALEKLKAIKIWLKNAKAQGRISMSDGMKLDEILGEQSSTETPT